MVFSNSETIVFKNLRHSRVWTWFTTMNEWGNHIGCATQPTCRWSMSRIFGNISVDHSNLCSFITQRVSLPFETYLDLKLWPSFFSMVDFRSQKKNRQQCVCIVWKNTFRIINMCVFCGNELGMRTQHAVILASSSIAKQNKTNRTQIESSIPSESQRNAMQTTTLKHLRRVFLYK